MVSGKAVRVPAHCLSAHMCAERARMGCLQMAVAAHVRVSNMSMQMWVFLQPVNPCPC